MSRQCRSISVVVNPASAGGSTARLWPRAEAALRTAGFVLDVHITEGPNHATALAHKAGESGYHVVLYVGGDGTANEVANGLLQLPRQDRPALASLPRGSGGDFPRALGMRPGIEQAVARLKADRRLAIDVAHSTFSAPSRTSVDRAFINVADAGLGGVVVERVNQSRKPLGGTIAFLWGSLTSFWTYANTPMKIVVDSTIIHEGPTATAVIANGNYFGGGLRIAPAARFDDGFLDIVVVGDINKADLITQLPHLYRGTHVRHPKVSIFRGREVSVESAVPSPLDLDGEQPGYTPFHVSLEPGAIDVLI
ncbi:MAG: diacylglycerol kinase family lipid kinase [Actinobacteria bacterium]|nr:diacylglycerol kinase family lipid kinase [Actinomycetota bacterium]